MAIVLNNFYIFITQVWYNSVKLILHKKCYIFLSYFHKCLIMPFFLKIPEVGHQLLISAALFSFTCCCCEHKTCWTPTTPDEGKN